MPSPIERKLAAIMFTDIAGYTESMSKSESKTLNLLEKKRSILKPLFKKYKGTFVKEIGDGTLSYFDSAVNAATCAVELQEATYDDKDMNIRVGIHIGDIVFKDGDVFGGGVNVASRLESIAPAGGVCVSKSVYDELSNQDEFDGIELGLQSLKGIGRLIEVYGLKGDKLTEPNPKEYQDNKIDKHSDDEVPSIAIIPFDNKGADEDVFYAYGISADLISDVSSAGLIRVASKKQIEDVGELPIDELAKKLDVRYMANGELWRMGEMFQLSVELYDTKDKKVVWSDRWQEKWDNLPSIKGSLSDGLLKVLDTKHKVEMKVETTSVEAYEYYLRGKHKYWKRENTDDTEIAQGLLQKAIELDDNFILAKNLLGVTYKQVGEYNKAMEMYILALKQANECGDKIAEGAVLNSIGNIYLNNIFDDNKAFDYYTQSFKIFEEVNDKQGMATALGNISLVYNQNGNYKKAMECLKRSSKISEESIPYNLGSIGNIYHRMGFDAKTLDYYKRSLKLLEGLGEKSETTIIYFWLGIYYYEKVDYNKAQYYFKKYYVIEDKIGREPHTPLWYYTYLYLIYKNLGKEYDINTIHSLIKDADENIDFELNLRLYELLEDKSYLETAYNQVKEKADNLEPNVKLKFLSYPIPKAIGEEWNKVK